MAKQECANAGQDSRSTVESNKSLVPSVSHPRGSATLCTPHTEQKRVPLWELVTNCSNEVQQVALHN